MELKIKNDNKNVLLSRREIEFYVTSKGSTPTLNDVHVQLCKSLNLNPVSTVIIRINQKFGIKQSIGYAHSYEDIEIMNKTEPKYVIVRKERRMSKQKPEKKESEQNDSEESGKGEK